MRAGGRWLEAGRKGSSSSSNMLVQAYAMTRMMNLKLGRSQKLDVKKNRIGVWGDMVEY